MDQNYDLSIFDKLTIMKNVYYNAAESVIKSNLRDTVKISNISSNYSKFFIRNGVPFVVITSSIDYSLEGNSTTHTALATTICWLEMGNNNS